MTTGEELKAAGIAQALDNPTTPPWKVVARQAIDELAARYHPFTAEDVRRMVGDPPTEKVIGAIFNAAARAGVIKRVGFVQTRRPSSHATMTSQWIGRGEIVAGDGVPRGVIPMPQMAATEESMPKDVWICSRCTAKIVEPPGEETILEGYRKGRCPDCRKSATFTRKESRKP